MEGKMEGSNAAPGQIEGLVRGSDGLMRPSWANTNELLRDYYDTEWGMPVKDERGIFERLSLEAFQSGLSWLTVLRKRKHSGRHSLASTRRWWHSSPMMMSVCCRRIPRSYAIGARSRRRSRTPVQRSSCGGGMVWPRWSGRSGPRTHRDHAMPPRFQPSHPNQPLLPSSFTRRDSRWSDPPQCMR